jgi:hypothetical protein
MWRADGRGEAYVYHMRQPNRYGESFSFAESLSFPEVDEVLIRMQVAMNTPGRADGGLRVWLRLPDSPEEVLVVLRTDMEWRADSTMRVDSLLFETFHGGNDGSWAPRKASATVFRGLTIRATDFPLDR